MIDFDGRWGWLNVKEKKDIQDIIEKLNQFESMTWGEIKGNKKSNHTIHTDKICKEARERLKERELDDLEEIFSLRLTATHRVWGKLERGVFHIIWWDPCHEICPSMLKHT